MGQLCMEFYLEQLKKRYIGSDRKAKALILDEFCSNSGFHRKHAIRLLSKSSSKKKAKNKAAGGRGRKKIYDPSLLLAPLKQIWFATDQMCGKRLKAAIPMWLPFYETSYGVLPPCAQQQLLTMSAATIDRLLLPSRIKFPKRMCGTKPGSLLKKHIPISTDQWNESRPGFFEADTVAHCGASLIGDFVWSLTFTDICTGWTENRAVWGKGSMGVLEAIKNIEQCLAFPILGFDSDNGDEFLNWHLRSMQIIPHARTLRKAREQVKMMVADDVSLPKIKNYLSRWVYWWMKTSSCWNYNELVNRYIHSCWNPTAKNRAMGFFQIDEITSSCNDVQACGCKHARPHNKF